MSFEKACSSAAVVHAPTSILAAREPAHFSAGWDEWILLTAREQEGVFSLFLKMDHHGPRFLGPPTSNLFLPRVTFDDSLM